MIRGLLVWGIFYLSYWKCFLNQNVSNILCVNPTFTKFLDLDVKLIIIILGIPYLSCIPRCRFNAKRSANAAVHISHLKGFSPECTLAWFLRCAAWLNAEPQVSHLLQQEKYVLALIK